MGVVKKHGRILLQTRGQIKAVNTLASTNRKHSIVEWIHHFFKSRDGISPDAYWHPRWN